MISAMFWGILFVAVVMIMQIEVATSSSTGGGLGYRDVIKRIIAGQETKPNQYPFMAEILNYESKSNKFLHKCGGSLIDAEWVLTTASCLVFSVDVARKVVLGEHDNTVDSGRERFHEVAEWHVHKEFFTDGYAYDIGLIKISPPADLTGSYIKTVKLPNKEDPIPEGQTCTALGWGTAERDENGLPVQDTSPVLRQIQIPIVSYKVCSAVNNQMPYSNIHEFSNICAGELTDKTGCKSDGGGPLVCKNDDDEWVAQGIISWGDFRCGPKFYSVFTKVKSFLDWIKMAKKEKPLTKPHACVDIHNHCSVWKSQGYCSWWEMLNKYYCRKTCGACE